MSPFKRNMTRVVIFTSIVLIGAGISSAIYFLKIQKNEATQNQLQFRELRLAANSINSSLEKLQNIANFFKPSEACAAHFEKKSTNNDNDWLNACISQLQAQINVTKEIPNLRVYNIQANSCQSLNTPIELALSGDVIVSSEASAAVNKNNCNDNYIVSLKLNIKDLLPEVALFSALMLTDSEGHVYARNTDLNADTSAFDININSLDQFFSEAATTIQVSNMQDISIAGINYRMYVQPVTDSYLSAIKELSNSNTNSKKYALVGLVPMSTINVSKLLVSPNVIVWAVLMMLLLVAFTPLLKLRFINDKYAFTNSDVSQLVIGLVVSAGILTIAASQQIFFQYFIDNKVEQGKLIHQNIQQDFKREINAILEHKKSIKPPNTDSITNDCINTDTESLSGTNANANFECNVVGDDTTGSNKMIFFNNTEPSLLSFKDSESNPNAYVIEQMATMGTNGSFAERSTLYSISPKLAIKSKIDISGREYFERAMNCNTWSLSNFLTASPQANSCPESAYFQRINNLEDGRKTTMLAIPQFEKAEITNSERTILIINTKLATFMNRVLPMNYGFAVFNEQGRVLYHSDDEVSLIQNIFVETDQNQQFKTAIRHQRNANNPIELELKYGGSKHIFISAPLVTKKSDNSLPWHLVVFFNESDLAMNNMLLVFLAVLLFLAVVMPLFLMLRFLTHQKFWNELLFYKEKKAAGYYKWAWFIASLSCACILSIGMIDDLIYRLVIWLFSGLVVVYLLHKNHKVDLRQYQKARFPEFAIMVVMGLFLLIGFSLTNINLPIIMENLYALIVGIIILALGSCFVSRRLKYLLRTKFGFIYSKPPATGKVRPRKYATNERYSSGFICYLLSLILFAGAVPAVLIANSAHGYLLQRQAQMQTLAIDTNIHQLKTANEDYLENFEINDPLINQIRTSWGNLSDWQSIIPANLLMYTNNAESRAWIDIGGLPDQNYTYPDNVLTKVNNYLGNHQKTLSDDKECSIIGKDGLSGVIRCSNYSVCKPKNETNNAGTFACERVNIKKNHRNNFTDDLIDHIFASLSIQDTLGTKLTYLALDETSSQTEYHQDIDVQKSQFTLMFRPDSYMLAASQQSWATIVLLIVGIFVVLYKALQSLVVRRLMGEHVAEHFRVVRPCDHYLSKEKRWPLLRLLSHQENSDDSANLQPVGGKRILLLNANVTSTLSLCAELSIALYENKVHHISDCVEINAGLNIFENSIRLALKQSSVLNVAINGLDEISNQSKLRYQALKVLSRLSTLPRLNIILVTDTAPVFRLLRQQAYKIDYAETPHVSDESESFVDIDEKLSWAKLFAIYEKEYIWVPQQKSNLRNPLSITKLVEFESKGWAELTQFKNNFYEYHRRIKSPLGNCKDVQGYWLPEQVVEFFLVQAGSFYRKQWELCTVHEKVALWQLANGAKINPTNLEIIDHLTRRGFIYRDKGWHIINESFRRFILTAESSRIFAQWMETTKSGLWSIIRIPLFILLFVLVAVVVYSSGFALNSVLGVATTVLGIIPLLLKNLTLIKGHSGVGE